MPPPLLFACRRIVVRCVREEPMRYPCILQDEDSGLYFVAETTGPRSWRYHRSRFTAWLEMVTTMSRLERG